MFGESIMSQCCGPENTLVCFKNLFFSFTPWCWDWNIKRISNIFKL
jgi:hypothetical protein